MSGTMEPPARGAGRAEVLARLTRPLEVIVRPCRPDDLEALEWFGLFTPHRALIREAWARHERGEVVMLVAEANDFPVGQLWLDLVRLRPEPAALLWALRVHPVLQGMGIGSALVGAAERLLAGRGVAEAEIGVERSNPGARRLYERLGYAVVREQREEYEYTTPDGVTMRVPVDEWMLRKRLGASA